MLALLILLYFSNNDDLINLKNDVFDELSFSLKSISEINPVNYSENDRLPLRAHFEHIKDIKYYCLKINQTVSNPNFQYNITCTENDFLSDAQLYNLNFTLNYIESLLFNYIKINRFNLTNNFDGFFYSFDFLVKIYTIPFPEKLKSIGGASSIVEVYENDFRPKISRIILPLLRIPNKIDYNNFMKDRFFLILFHEVVHCLGFASFMFKYFLNRETGLPWGDNFPLISYTNPKYPNKNFSILYTPMAQKYASQRFGINEFAPGIPMGIEMENNGDSGTVGHHPELRVYMNEVFVGIIVNHPMYISDLVLSLIEDMGWYSVDFSLAEHLPWGNHESLNTAPLMDFPNKPPLSIFPHNYLVTNQQKKVGCSYDFKSIGKISIESFTCPNETNYCNSLSFYNSEFFPYKGVERVDFLPLYRSDNNSYCQNPINSFNVENSNIFSMNFSLNSYCLDFSLKKKTITT